MSESPKIQISVAFEGRSIAFNIRKDKPLMKVFNVFAERMNMDRSTLRFSYNGKTVRGNEDDTADNLGMEEGDEIDAFVQQVGGGWNGI